MPTLRAMGLYATLTALLTWPLARNLTIMDPGDSAFFAWEIGWELHALKTDPVRLPHGNIFHPLPYTLGMDEPVLGTTLLVLPLAPFTDDAVLLHNLARLLTFAFSGLTAFWLARELGVGEGAALLAGAAFAFSPIRTDQIAHLSTLGTQWLPLVVLFAVRFSRTGRTTHALLSALFFVLSFLACGYHGVIALAVLPPAFLVLLWGRKRLLVQATAAAALAGIALLPLYLMHRAALQPERYERGADETILYSAALESFLATSSWNRLYGGVTEPFRTIGPNNLFPGLLLPALVLWAAVRRFRQGERPSREAVALAVMALLAILVALGPRVRGFGADLGPGPFGLLREVIPVFTMIRVTSRAGAFLALPLALLAAKAIAHWRPKPTVFAGLFLLAVAEGVFAPVPTPEWTKVIDSRREPPEVYRWLRAQPAGTPVVELPMLDVYGLERRPAYHESIYMVYSTTHWQPLVNGYAGIEPFRYRRYRELARSFPAEEFLDEMRTIGVRYVVVHRGGYGPNQWARLEKALPGALERSLREVASFGGDTVFELLPGR
ncbi:MAG TPA: hypothetical protein VI589_09060 [Vicinamibacteria bacterium]